MTIFLRDGFVLGNSQHRTVGRLLFIRDLRTSGPEGMKHWKAHEAEALPEPSGPQVFHPGYTQKHNKSARLVFGVKSREDIRGKKQDHFLHECFYKNNFVFTIYYLVALQGI